MLRYTIMGINNHNEHIKTLLDKVKYVIVLEIEDNINQNSDHRASIDSENANPANNDSHKIDFHDIDNMIRRYVLNHEEEKVIMTYARKFHELANKLYDSYYQEDFDKDLSKPEMYGIWQSSAIGASIGAGLGLITGISLENYGVGDKNITTFLTAFGIIFGQAIGQLYEGLTKHFAIKKGYTPIIHKSKFEIEDENNLNTLCEELSKIAKNTKRRGKYSIIPYAQIIDHNSFATDNKYISPSSFHDKNLPNQLIHEINTPLEHYKNVILKTSIPKGNYYRDNKN